MYVGWHVERAIASTGVIVMSLAIIRYGQDEWVLERGTGRLWFIIKGEVRAFRPMFNIGHPGFKSNTFIWRSTANYSFQND